MRLLCTLFLRYKNENAFYNLLKHNGIVNVKQTDKYSPYDFKIEINKTNIYIELKTRTISKEQYDTTILAVNKIDFLNMYIIKT